MFNHGTLLQLVAHRRHVFKAPGMKVGLTALAALAGCILGVSAGHAADSPTAVGSVADGLRGRIASAVDTAVRPLMQEFHIPGMAVGIVAGGKSYIFNYGVASTQTAKPVADDTLFEIGSITKTLTATLTSYAQVNGYLISVGHDWEVSAAPAGQRVWQGDAPQSRHAHAGGTSAAGAG